MKKKLMSLFLMGALLIGPSMSGTNEAKADPIEGAGKILEAVVDLFCPDNPQNRCKHGSCMDGACISFRKACKTDTDCK